MQIFKKISNIIKAYVFYFKHGIRENYLANLRLEVCEYCDHCKGTQVKYCDKCHCILTVKAYSKESGACPEHKWDIIDKTFNIK